MKSKGELFGFVCTRCGQEIIEGDEYISTGNGKKYHHPKCSEGVPVFRHWIRSDTPDKRPLD